MRRLFGGILTGFVALVVALGSTTMVAHGLPLAPAFGERIRAQDLAPISGDCVCPPPSERKPRLWYRKRYRVPTRCFKENVTAAGNSVRWPTNAWGHAYPDVKFPVGYPARTLPGVEGGRIPFPGWPRDRIPKANRPSRWHASSALRDNYKEWYVSKSGGRGTAPGDVGQAFDMYTRRGRYTGWGFWQIHHIMERQFGGLDNYENLVPVYSYPNKAWRQSAAQQAFLGASKPNHHNEFTFWWEMIHTDCEPGVRLYNCKPGWKRRKANCPGR